MAAIAFPTSTAPSINPTENGGRLINAIIERAPVGSRSEWIWRRSPGLEPLFEVDEGAFRGAIPAGNALIVIAGNSAFEVGQAGGGFIVTPLTGTVGGTSPVIMARNMRSPDPQTLIVHDGGIDKIEAGAVTEFTTATFASPNSVTYQDGYFFVTLGDGRVFASGIDDVTFNALDFATARASVDPLLRAVAFGSDVLLLGTTTIEFWNNTANPEAFPYSRGPVLPVGLLAPYAVTGFEYGFPAPISWVSTDRRIYRLVGYSPEPISTPHIDRLLQDIPDPTTLRAFCYVSAGRPCYVFTCPEWTLVYDASNGSWHERKSYGDPIWRAMFSANAFGRWVTFDRNSPMVFSIKDRHRREGDKPLIWEVHSTQMHGFPLRSVIRRASFDMVAGVGNDTGIAPIETNPRVDIAWSFDGGRTFGNDLQRELGTQGETRPLDIRNLGMAQRLGVQYRLRVSDPVEVSLMGGAHDVEGRVA